MLQQFSIVHRLTSENEGKHYLTTRETITQTVTQNQKSHFFVAVIFQALLILVVYQCFLQTSSSNK